MKEIVTDRPLSMQIPILQTKLNVPQKTTTTLIRTKLMEILNESKSKQVITVTAPAGFGKTSLVSEWIRGLPFEVGWVSLELGENDPIRFWNYILCALKDVVPLLVKNAHTLLESMPLSSAESIVVPLIQEVAKYPSDFFLVLDDYHMIENSLIHRAMIYLISHLPKNMKLVLISRALLPLPLHRLRLEDLVMELDTEDLRFSRSEIKCFFDKVDIPLLTDSDLDLLEKHTEGWIVGMKLLALSIGKKKNVSAFLTYFSGFDRYIFEYLTEEVLKNYNAATRNFLLETSILERMTGPLCKTVTGEKHANDILVTLHKESGFIFPLDHDGHWYRYHQFFRNLLKRRLLDEQGENVLLLHQRAAYWLDQHGFVQEAIDHAFLSQDFEMATKLIDNIAPEIVKKREFSTIQTWMNRFPEEWMDTHPSLCVIITWVFALTGEYSKAEATLLKTEKYVKGAKGESFEHILVEMDVLRGYLAIIAKDADKAVQYMRSSITRQPKYSRFFQLGMILNQDGPCLLHSELGLKGSLTKVNQIYTQLRKIWKHSGLPIVGYGSVILGELYYERNQLENVHYFIKRGLQIGEENQNIGILMPIYFLAINMKRALQQQDEIGPLIEKMEKKLMEWNISPHWSEMLDSLKVEMLINAGRLPEVHKWLDTKQLHSDDSVMNAKTYPYTIYARSLHAVGRTEEAIALLDKLITNAKADDRLASTIKMLFIKSLMMHETGKKNEACQLLDRVLDLAEPDGYVRTFLDEGEPAQKLFISYSRNKKGAYLSRLLLLFDEEFGPAVNHSNQSLIEPLTNRELEVLELLEKGLTNKEIANKLFITIGTVKSYNHNIYAKLQVKNRTQALAHARKIALLG
ncbi:LuxR C-terminal-related transcriptional regulator [Virgibacillus sp. FSP13]